MITGTTSSTGIACGKIYVLDEDNIPTRKMTEYTPQKELDRFNRAVQESLEDLVKLRNEIRIKIGEREEGIFEAQSLILEDPAFVDEIRECIVNGLLVSEMAVKGAIVKLEQQFLEIEDKTIRQRIIDIKDVGNRILRALARDYSSGLEKIKEPIVLVAEELFPSQAASLDREKVLAIITEKGGINSHASIIARSLDIPAVVGVRGLMREARASNYVIVDGFSGSVYFNPQSALIDKYLKMKTDSKNRHIETKPAPAGKIKTKNGTDISLFLNIGRLSELNGLKELGVEGVGVLRTEFLLMDRESPPTVDEFAASFKTVLEYMSPLPVNIRLLDIGGDKQFPYISTVKEINPALGNRGARFLLSNPHLLKAQVQGILEAQSAGNARILIPMITTHQEIREITGIIRRMEADLAAQGKIEKGRIKIGLMVETPAAAILAQYFVNDIDFISIGTNDLSQYTLAADRDNEHVQDIYNCLNPAVLLMIDNCVRAARKAGIEICICGEMASNIRAIPVLLGMGIKQLSVGVMHAPEVKEILRKVDVEKARALVVKALKTSDVIEVEKMVTRFMRKIEKNSFE